MNLREGTRRLALILGIACAFGSPINAQTQTGGDAKVSLELGSVTVWLGMPETEALSGFQRAGYKVLGMPSALTKMIVNDKTAYSVGFKGGRLVYADREWPSSGSGELDAVLRAMAALASHGTTSCSIIHAPISKPDGSLNRIFIDCGERSVLLAKGTFEASGENRFVTISERIGEPQ
jgi:hypothetical protein